MTNAHLVQISENPRGWRVPGIANLHSHAFQRAMAGMAERQGDPNDSFWTWRKTMYAMAERFDPDSLYAVAAQLYAEMLTAGYTRVVEFHYLHHAPNGQPYANPAAMSQALLAAARDTGIRITLAPVLYMRGGFDDAPLAARQRRFAHTVDSWLHLFEQLRAEEGQHVRIACAVHSLRAVPLPALREVCVALPADTPIHIHIAEQMAEVDDCRQQHGNTPVALLLDSVNVDRHWTLVHATHLSDTEVQGIADAGATVAICPTTEANLGDGIFRFSDFLAAGGRWGIGSDSHVSVSPVEELRWLEYAQRLTQQRRNIAVRDGSPSVAATLLTDVAASATDATGLTSADEWLWLDAQAPILAGSSDADVLDRWVFSGNRPTVKEVSIGGVTWVRDGAHIHSERIAEQYRRAIVKLV